VFGEMVTAHEPFVTLGTSKSLLSCVCSDVPLKFVRAHESLAAEQPVAEERTLAAVPSQVRLEV